MLPDLLRHRFGLSFRSRVIRQHGYLYLGIRCVFLTIHLWILAGHAAFLSCVAGNSILSMYVKLAALQGARGLIPRPARAPPPRSIRGLRVCFVGHLSRAIEQAQWGI